MSIDIVMAIAEGIFVSLDWHVVPVSISAILVLIINHLDMVKDMIKRIKTKNIV